MVRVADAEDRIARFEADVFRDDVRVERPPQWKPPRTATVEDFFERLARMRNGDGPVE